MDRLDRSLFLFALNPKSGRMRPDIGRGVRSFVVGRYVVFYRAVSGGIDVGRVLHGARNIAPEDILRSLKIDRSA